MNLIGRECRLRDLEGCFLAWLFLMTLMNPSSQVDALDPFTQAALKAYVAMGGGYSVFGVPILRIMKG